MVCPQQTPSPKINFWSKLFSSHFNLLSRNPTKWLNTLKQLVGNSQQIVWVCLTILWGWWLKLKGQSTNKKSCYEGLHFKLIKVWFCLKKCWSISSILKNILIQIFEDKKNIQSLQKYNSLSSTALDYLFYLLHLKPSVLIAKIWLKAPNVSF